MDVHDQHKLANNINDDIYKSFVNCLGPMSRVLVMERVLSLPCVNVNTPNYVLPAKLAFVEQEVLASVSQSLGEIKQTNSNVKLASKHCILATSISAKPTSSMRNIARVLGVHHRNASNEMERCKVFNDYGAMLWTLSF